MLSNKALIIEINGPDDITTHNGLRRTCGGWAWQSGILIHRPGTQQPMSVTPALAEEINRVLSSGQFPADIPYRMDRTTRRLDIRDV